ncbi:uncharacterized protein [Physcomitrium patens]|uniref:uncharacterized protein n=1 Tax=Physcomitrium patens TaxID=3218 RepID=UPI003CCD54DB
MGADLRGALSHCGPTTNDPQLPHLFIPRCIDHHLHFMVHVELRHNQRTESWRDVFSSHKYAILLHRHYQYIVRNWRARCHNRDHARHVETCKIQVRVPGLHVLCAVHHNPTLKRPLLVFR